MKRIGKLLLSLGISAICFWYVFKDTHWFSYVDPVLGPQPGMWDGLKSANYWWLIPYLGLLTAVHLCRTLRWGAWLSPLEKVPFKKLNEAAGIGFMMLIVLPFRLGEFARPFLIAQRSRIRRSAAMSSVVLERIVDGIIIAVLLRILLFFIPTETEDIRRIRLGANLMFAVFFGGLLFLLFALWQRDRAVRWVRATAGVVSPALADKVAEIVDNFVGAVRQLPRGREMFGFFFFSALYWVLNGLGMSLLANAFDCTFGGAQVCAPLRLSVFQGFVVLCVLVAGLMIPAAPGSAGTFQASIKLALSVFVPSAVVNSSGVAYANVVWLVQISQQILFGLILMASSRQSFRDIAGTLSREAEGPAPAAEALPGKETPIG